VPSDPANGAPQAALESDEPPPELEELELDDESLDELELEDSELDEPPDLLLPLELYRSEYQPPPLRMKPPPREICRLACAWLHLGQSVRGAAVIDCWASHWWPQAWQMYS
jgi:hypothetical protein